MTKELKIEPSSYPCHILNTDFDTGIVSIQMLGDAYKVSSGMKYLSDKPPVKELTDEEMMKVEYEFLTWNRSLDKPLVEISYELGVFKQAVEILRKAQDK